MTVRDATAQGVTVARTEFGTRTLDEARALVRAAALEAALDRTVTITHGTQRWQGAPTWYNPAPNGWGAAMPSVIGPGPNNPLGLRAVNWMDGDRDTLIRFHGTANTASIGAAASRGCVRLTNRDVVELFDMVKPGATIVSLRE